MNEHIFAIIRKIGDKECITKINQPQTTVGRGKKFEVGDKRVSRNHAELILDSNTLTLKSTRSNPCFLNLKNRNKKILLKQGGSIVLQHGDEFSLLQDEYFFQVLIQIKNIEKQENSQEMIVQPDISSKKAAIGNIKTEDYKLNTAAAEESVNSLNSDISSKLAKVSPESNDTRKKLKKIFPNKKSPDTCNITNGSDFQKKRKLPSWMLNQSKKAVLSKSKTGSNKVFDRDEVQTSENNTTFAKCTETKTEIVRISSDKGKDLSVPNSNMSFISAAADVKEDQPQPEFVETSDIDQSVAYLNSEDDSDVDTSAKDTASTVGDIQTNNLCTIKADPSKTLDVCAVEVESNRNSASSSNIDSNPVKTREPCVYGKSCYRKNPDHFKEYSHPGDADYFCGSPSDDDDDDDDNGNKPECEYGLQCYRKNPSHKRKFKHTVRVTPKRLATKQKKVKATNGDDSDEYDLDDSFIDDDEEDVSDDSDWAPSGNKKNKSKSDDDETSDEEDVSDLLTSAKKFVKNKKLWKK